MTLNLQDLDLFAYKRISSERERNKIAVEDQDKDITSTGKRLDLNIVASFEDRNISALAKDTGIVPDRPGYNELLDAVMNHPRPCGIIVVDFDRLWRDDVQQQSALAILEAKSELALVITTGGLSIEVGNDDSTLMAAILALFAKYAVRKNRAKLMRRLVHKAERGEYHGGVRSWGYEHETVIPVLDERGEPVLTKRYKLPKYERSGKLVIVAEEREQVRETARRLLAGETTRSIVLDFNRRGVKTPAGAQWQVNTLARAIQLPKLAGRRQHGDHGVFDATEWEPILTLEEHERLVALFASRKIGPRQAATKHPLTGTIKCHCGSKLAVGTIRGVVRYRCATSGNGGCGSAGVVKHHAEARVLDLLADHFDSPKLAAALERQQQLAAKADARLAALRDELNRDRARLAEIEADYRDSKTDKAKYLRLSTPLEERIAENEKAYERQCAQSGPMLQWVGDGDRLRRSWDRMTPEEQRAIAYGAASAFVVSPGEQNGGKWNPERIQPEWRFSQAA